MSAEMSLKSYRERVEIRLGQLLPDASAPPARLHEAMRYMALAPGKRLRPILCLASSAAVGGPDDSAMEPACAAEMVHCFSLIHDDLPALDNDDLRRGRPTCHKVYGEAMAILAGDGLFSLAFETLSNAEMPPSRITECIARLSQASGRLVRGEVMDIEGEGSTLSLAEIESIHKNKTAALFSASCAMGAIAGGGTAEEVAQLSRYGEMLGMAFQIADDLLNETATEAELGKAVGSDRGKNKSTYVAHLGLGDAKNAAHQMARSAIQNLDGLDGPTEILKELAEFSVTRRS